MIDISRAQANQTTTNGVNEDWVVTLDKEEIYRLPANFSVQDTFLVRDIAEKMMKMSASSAKEQAEQLSLVKIQHIVSNGDSQLDELRRENERLSTILEQYIGE